jgi:hypothetical protein
MIKSDLSRRGSDQEYAEPVYRSCCALLGTDLTGSLEVWGGDPYPCGIVRYIEKGAKLTIVENAYVGPKLARYTPHPMAK